MNRGKGRQSSKHQKSGQYSAQFRRTVRNTGKWRGKDPDKYVKYVKKKKVKHYGKQWDNKTKPVRKPRV